MYQNHLHIKSLAVCLIAVLACCIPGAAWGQQSNVEILNDIKNAYENLNFPVAEARIEEAIHSFDHFTPVELGEIYSISALIFFARNDQEGTRRQLGLALQINPNLKLSSRDTPPQVITILDELIQIRAADLPSETELRYLVVQDPRPAAVMRSMIFPGWGQLYKKQKKKGLVLMSAWGVASIGTLVAHVKRRQAEDYYLASINKVEIDARYPSFDNWHKARNNLFVAAAGIWVFSYIDALIQNPSPSNQNKSSPLQLSITPIPHSPNFVLRYSF